MSKSPTNANDPAALRHKAETRLLAKKQSQSKAPAEDASRALYELEIHQIALEMQNEELRDSRDKLEALLEKYTDLYDFAPVGYLTLDPAGCVCEANLAAATLLGFPRSALMGKRFDFFITAAEKSAFAAFQENVFASNVRQNCEVTLKLENRPLLIAEVKGISFEPGRACRITITDITERKQSEADRLVLNKLESTGILAGGIAHDFNNLLSIMLLNIEQANSPGVSGDAAGCYLEEAKKSILLARGLTSQFLTLSDGGAPILTDVPLPELIQESAQLTLSGSDVRCVYSLADDLWEVRADAGQIGQVIRNIILNSRQAMPEGGEIFVRAENVVLGKQNPPCLTPGDYIQVTIADHGVGISESVLPKIFDPYFSTKQRGNEKGMGLGLTICHSVIQKHFGTITAESIAGEGSTFRICLPASRVSRGGEKASLQAENGKRLRVLVMDDEPGMRKVLGHTLEMLGHETEVVDEGQKAIDIYIQGRNSGRPFDVVVLDLTVRSGLNGKETVKALLTMNPDLRAIAISGYASDPVMMEPERHGFRGALPKPFAPRKLQEMIFTVMRS